MQVGKIVVCSCRNEAGGFCVYLIVRDLPQKVYTIYGTSRVIIHDTDEEYLQAINQILKALCVFIVPN